MRLLLTPMLSEDFKFVDHHGLKNRTSVASSDSMCRTSVFRPAITRRDGCCVVTGEDVEDCDAAHIIPRSKGDAVGFFVGFCLCLMTNLTVYFTSHSRSPKLLCSTTGRFS